MQKDKGSWAKVGICCSITCTLTGLAYGLLYTSGCPCTPMGLGVMAFFTVLGWYAVFFLIWAIIRRRFVKLALGLFLAENLASLVAVGLIFHFASMAYPAIHK